MKCVKKIEYDVSMCTTSCNGLMVTGFTKFDFQDYPKKDIQRTLDDYKNYKKWFKFPSGIKV